VKRGAREGELRAHLEAELARTRELGGNLESLGAERAGLARDHAAAQERIAEQDNELREYADMVRALHEQLAASGGKAETLGADLLAAEDRIRTLEAELRAREAAIERLEHAEREARARLGEIAHSLEERNALIGRLETEAASSAAVLGSIQLNLERLGQDDALPSERATAPVGSDAGSGAGSGPGAAFRGGRCQRRTRPGPVTRILKSKVYDVAEETPLEIAPLLSARLGNTLLLKREDLQPVFSFKLRGAYNKMARLPQAALARGVIAASAGNHAQGVALSAQKLGCKAVIVMPVTTPRIKIDAVTARGAKVVLAGDVLQRRLHDGPRTRDEGQAHLRAPLRRPGRHRRPGHDRHGDPAAPQRPARRHLRGRRRRRPDRRHRQPT
jgi:hypothetical protein